MREQTYIIISKNIPTSCFVLCLVFKVSGQEQSPRGNRILKIPIWPQSLGISQDCMYEEHQKRLVKERGRFLFYFLRLGSGFVNMLFLSKMIVMRPNVCTGA